MGRKLYYFHKNSGLEVDFVIRYKGKCTLVEVKAATGNTKSTKTILRHPEKYHVDSAIKLGTITWDGQNRFSPCRCIWHFCCGQCKLEMEQMGGERIAE